MSLLPPTWNMSHNMTTTYGTKPTRDDTFGNTWPTKKAPNYAN